MTAIGACARRGGGPEPSRSAIPSRCRVHRACPLAVEHARPALLVPALHAQNQAGVGVLTWFRSQLRGTHSNSTMLAPARQHVVPPCCLVLLAWPNCPLDRNTVPPRPGRAWLEALQDQAGRHS